jgi:hypothetical protein
MFQQIQGLQALYTLSASSAPYMQMLRKLFRAHLQTLQKHSQLDQLLNFVELCFHWRLCEEFEVRKLLLQHILVNCLTPDGGVLSILDLDDGKSSAKLQQQHQGSQKGKKRHHLNPFIHAIQQHLTKGESFHIHTLDPVLFGSLQQLAPYYLPFLCHSQQLQTLLEQEGWNKELEDIQLLAAELVDVATVLIQCAIRRYLARCKVRMIRLTSNK